MKQIIIFALLVIAATAQKTASRAESDAPRPSRGSRKFNTANVNDELGISSRSSFWNPDGDKQEKKVLSASERATLASQRRNHQQSVKPRPTTQKVTDSEPEAASSVVAPVITQQQFLSRREKATRRSDSILPEDIEAQPTFPSRRRPSVPEEGPRPDSGRRRPPAPVSENPADTPVPPRRVGSRRPSASRSAPLEEEEAPVTRQRAGRRPSSSRQRTEVRARPVPTEASAPAPLTTEAAAPPPPPAEAFQPLEPAPAAAVELPQPDVAAPVVTELSMTEAELVKATEVSSTTVKSTTPAQTAAPAQEDTEPRYQGRRGGSGRNRGAQEAKASRRLPQSSRSNVESADEVTPPPAAFSRTGRRNGPSSTAAPAPQTDSKRRPYRPADAPAETPSEPKRRPFRPAPATAAAAENDVPPLPQEFKRRPTARPADNTEPNDVPPTLPDFRRSRPSNRPPPSVEATQGGDVEPRRPTTRARTVARGGRRGAETQAEAAEGAAVQRTSRKINADTSPRGGYKQSRRSGVSKLRTTSRPSVPIDDIDEDANYPPEFIKALKLTDDTKVKESSTKSSSQDLDETFVTKSSQTVSSVSIPPQSLSEDSQGTDDTKSKNINEELVNKGDARKRTHKYSRPNRPSRQPQNQESDSDQKVKKLNLLLAPSPPSENKEEEPTKESTITTLRDRYKPSGSYTLRGSKSTRGDDEKKQTNKDESTTLSLQELPVPSSTPAIRNPIASLQAKQGFRFKNRRFSKPKEENDNAVASTTESQVTQVIKTSRKSLFPSTTQSNFVSRKRFSSLKRNQETNTVTVKPTEYSEPSTRSYKFRSTSSRTTSAFRRSAVATTEAITGDLLPATKLKYSARFRSDLLLATGGLRSTSTPAYVPTVPLIRTSTTTDSVSTGSGKWSARGASADSRSPQANLL